VTINLIIRTRTRLTSHVYHPTRDIMYRYPATASIINQKQVSALMTTVVVLIKVSNISYDGFHLISVTLYLHLYSNHHNQNQGR
jgi:hypothetical protein